MKENQNNIVVFLLILLLLIVIGMSVFIVVDKLPKQNTNNVQNEDNGSNTDNVQNGNNVPSQKTILYKDSTKNLVYDIEKTAYNEAQNFSIKVKLPYVNIDSTYAEEINKAIINIELETYNTVSYSSYLNDNILSIVIRMANRLAAIEEVYYLVYNIDIYTGERVSNAEILNYLNTTEEKVLKQLPEKYKNAFVSIWKDHLNEVYEDYTKSDVYKETVSQNTYSAMFIGKNRSLKVIGRIYALIGHGCYYEVMDIDL